MMCGKDCSFFGEFAVQYPSVQKFPPDSPEQENRKILHRDRFKEIGKITSTRPIVALIVFRFDDNRRRDVDGAVATVCDALVRAGILEDDDTVHLSGVCVTSVKVPKGRAGVDIILRYEA